LKFFSNELKSQAKVFAIHGLNGIFDTDFPPLLTFFSTAIFCAVTDKPLNPKYIVLVTSYYWIISLNLQYFFIRGLIFLIGAFVSLRRVQVSFKKILRIVLC
jgi:hypothetical protein